MKTISCYNIIVIGSGPAGQKAAIQGARAGARVLLIEKEDGIGGNGIYRGVIPSKTLRETALQLHRIQRSLHTVECRLRPGLELATMMSRVEEVVRTHTTHMTDHLRRSGVVHLQGFAHFISDDEIEVLTAYGPSQTQKADYIILAAGSTPTTTPQMPVDHEHIFDSDSILSMTTVPRSMTVVGGGVVGAEYVSVFALLGVEVTLLDVADRPLPFIDQEIVQTFVAAFEKSGGRFVGNQMVADARWNGHSKVVVQTESGLPFDSETMLVAIGRSPNIAGLRLEAAGITLTDGKLAVNQYGQTNVPHIYAVGDMAGAPMLASRSMEQGRHAVAHALKLPITELPSYAPIGIHTLPEVASVGLDETTARSRFTSPLVGHAEFNEIARGQISGVTDGVLKMVADPSGKKILGVQIVGESAIELIHLGLLGLQHGIEVDEFLDSALNFPTFAEAYRVAALDIVGKRAKRELNEAA